MDEKLSEKIKVARIATVPEAFIHIIDNIHDYQNANFQIDLICSHNQKTEFLLKEAGVNVIYCEIPRGLSIIKDLLAIFLLTRILIKNNYDIVHSHTPKAGIITAIAGIFSFRKVRLHTFTGQRWVTLGQPLKSIMRFFDKLVVKLNTQCYADSQSQVDFLVSQKIATPNHLFCLGKGSFGGVNTTKFNSHDKDKKKEVISNQFHIPYEKPWAIFVGRLVGDKGINELIKAHKIVQKTHDLQLLLIGSFEDELDPITPEIKEIIRFSTNIHLIGFQQNPAHFMTAADFLCLPSYREGFGNVIIEAAACETPSIGADIPGLQDAILDKKTGILVPKMNIDELANAMNNLIENVEQRQKMGKMAALRAHQFFASQYLSQLQMIEYQKLVSNKTK